MLSGDQKVPFVGTFSAQKAAQSSTEREKKGYEAAITTAVKKFPDQIHGISVLVKLGDNQGAISALNHLRSPVPGIHQSLQRVFQLCSQNNFDVVARWTSRENLAEADELSRRPDASDWEIEKSTFQAVCNWFCVHPQIDLFASGVNHVIPRFVTPYYKPNCEAVHAYKLDW
jgi:hypothetical protein